jgi:predicted DNA binding CopG/RHH family protein
MKKIPSFKSEKAEREFWAKHDSTEYLDWSRARRVALPKLQPSVRTISLRLPESMLEELKVLANRDDVPYQSLIKVFLADRIRREHGAVEGKDGSRLPVAKRVRRVGAPAAAQPGGRRTGGRRK